MKFSDQLFGLFQRFNEQIIQKNLKKQKITKKTPNRSLFSKTFKLIYIPFFSPK